jgi:cation diffusion facilitator family transporter
MTELQRPKEELYREALRAAGLGLVVNGGLGAAKLVGGLIGQSFALLADAVNSLGDVVTSAAVMFALWVAQRPADKEHPYGHTRAEAIAGSNVALLILISALALGWEALRRFRVAHGPPPLWTLAIAGANILIKEALYRYKIRVGRRLGSRALIANAWDHRSDALCALAVLVGLGLVRIGGPRWSAADEVAALVVVAAISVSALGLLRTSVHELMDVQADDELLDQVRREALSVPEVRGVETLWLRKTGLEYLADIHIEVDAGLTIAEGHRIGHRVKDRLLARLPALRDVLVHLEPYPHPHDGSPAKQAISGIDAGFNSD